MNRVAKVAAALVGALTVTGGAAIAAPVEWKMHVVWVPSRPEAVSMKEFADKANELSAGTLKISVFDSGSLGVKDPDMLRVLPSGSTIQAAGLSPAYLTRDLPELPYALPVGVLPAPDDALKVAAPLEKIYREIYARHGIRLLGLVTSPVRNSHIWCKEPINSLSGLKGKKVRVWGKFQVDTFSKLGIAGQIVPQNDMYLALQTGVVDCAAYALAFGKTISLQEVAKNVAYLHPYSEAPLAVIVSESSYNALPEKARRALDEAGKWIMARTEEQFRQGAVLEQQAAADMKAAGVTVMADFSKEDQDAYRKASIEVWLAVSKSLGARGVANYEAVSGALK